MSRQGGRDGEECIREDQGPGWRAGLWGSHWPGLSSTLGCLHYSGIACVYWIRSQHALIPGSWKGTKSEPQAGRWGEECGTSLWQQPDLRQHSPSRAILPDGTVQPIPLQLQNPVRGRAIFTDPSYKHQGAGQGHDADSRRELGPHTDLLLTLGIS